MHKPVRFACRWIPILPNLPNFHPAATKA
jgi:hypothetical protein